MPKCQNNTPPKTKPAQKVSNKKMTRNKAEDRKKSFEQRQYRMDISLLHTQHSNASTQRFAGQWGSQGDGRRVPGQQQCLVGGVVFHPWGTGGHNKYSVSVLLWWTVVWNMPYLCCTITRVGTCMHVCTYANMCTFM